MARRIARRQPNQGVVGIDPSLTATGIATDEGVFTIQPSGLTGPARLISIRDQVLKIVHAAKPELVVIEDYAYGASNQAHQLGELGGVLNVALYEAGFRYVRPSLTHIKMYATGNGNAKKFLVGQELVKRLGITVADDNQSDAAWCRAIGYGLLGRPLVDLPKTHTRALERVEWAS